MAHEDYIAKIHQLFELQRSKFIEDAGSLEAILDEILSFELGKGIVNSVHPDMTQDAILSRLTSSDLLYLSLIDSIPAGIEPLAHDYSVTAKGLKFNDGRKNRIAKFTQALDNYLFNFLYFIERKEDDVLREGQAIFNSLKNEATSEDAILNGKYGDILQKYIIQIKPVTEEEYFRLINKFIKSLISSNSTTTSLTEIATAENINSYVAECIASKLASPNVLSSLKEPKGLLFGEGGIIILDKKNNDFNFLSYNGEYQKEISEFLNVFRRYHNIGKLDTLHFSAFKKLLLNSIEEAVDKKVRLLPEDKLSQIEKRALELESKYSIKISYKKMHTTPQKFSPTFSVLELDILDTILEKISLMSGLYISEINKQENPKDYDGNPKSALKSVKNKFSKIYTNIMHDTSDESLLVRALQEKWSDTPKGVLSLNEADLSALKQDFNGLFPYYLQLIAKKIYIELPQIKQEGYISLIRPDLERNMQRFMAYNFSRRDALEGSALMDFVKSAAEYQIAKIEERPVQLSQQKIRYFDLLFSPRLKSS